MKTNRKTILGISLFLLLLTLFALSISAAEPVETWDISSGSSDSVTAYLYNDPENEGYYTMTISGNGNMRDWGWGDAPWYSPYRHKIKSVTIENGVINIGSGAFCNCTFLENIELSNDLTAIGNSAFSYCYSLASVTIPYSVNSIGIGVFTMCEILTSVEVDENNQHYCDIDGNLYNKNQSMLIRYMPMNRSAHFVIPDSVTDICSGAFNYSRFLESVAIPNGVKNVTASAFTRCYDLESVTIPEGVVSIGDSAFSECTNLSSITIPASVTDIGVNAFYNCDSLTSIVFPDGVTSIENSAFGFCDSLKSVEISSSIDSIAVDAFKGCEALKSIKVDEKNQYYCDINGNLYSKGGTTLIQYAIGKENIHFVVPDCVLVIEKYAFYDTKLEHIIIPGSVSCMYGSAFPAYGPVLYVEIEKEECNWYGRDGWDLSDCVAWGWENPTQWCSFEATMNFPTCTEQGYTAYICVCGYSYLDNYVEPTGHTFDYSNVPKANCQFERELYAPCLYCDEAEIGIIGTIPHEYTEFVECMQEPTCSKEGVAIYMCNMCYEATTEIAVPINPDNHTYENGYCIGCGVQSAVMTWDISATENDSVFAYLYNDPENEGYYTLTITGNGNMKDWTRIPFSPWYDLYRRKITSVTIGDSVANIGSYAFSECYELATLIIENGVTIIGEYAFSNCTSLTSVEIPDSVTSISRSAFSACYYLSNVIIPDSVTSIGDYGFNFCRALTSIVIPNSIINMGSGVFKDCFKLTIYAEVESQPDGWSSSWNYHSRPVVWGIKDNGILENGLVWVRLSDDTVTIAGYLNIDIEVVIPSVINGYSVTTIGDSAFSDCDSLTSVVIPDSVTTIGGYAFRNCSSLTIYAEAPSKPSGWSSSWNYSNRPVVWGYIDKEATLGEIFTFLGYSFNEEGSMAVGYEINYEALKKYEEKTGEVLEIGVVFAGYSLLNGNQPLDSQGNAITLDDGAVVKFDLTEYDYTYYDFIVTDIIDSIKDIPLVISAYINNGAENKYIQENGMSDTVIGISYNEAKE